MKTDNTLHEIRLEMWRRGGEFVRSLSQTIGKADIENRERLLAAFPEIVERYDAFASLSKKEQLELEEAP
jgi:hypothetical protein